MSLRPSTLTRRQFVGGAAVAALGAAGVLERYHGRGANELAHRGLKDFGSETLPFKRFESNAAFYYTMVMAFNLFESFKEDVVRDVIPVASYATAVRRKPFDIVGKIVRKGRSTILLPASILATDTTPGVRPGLGCGRRIPRPECSGGRLDGLLSRPRGRCDPIRHGHVPIGGSPATLLGPPGKESLRLG